MVSQEIPDLLGLVAKKQTILKLPSQKDENSDSDESVDANEEADFIIPQNVEVGKQNGQITNTSSPDGKLENYAFNQDAVSFVSDEVSEQVSFGLRQYDGTPISSGYATTQFPPGVLNTNTNRGLVLRRADIV